MKRGVIKVAKKGFDVRYVHPKSLTIYTAGNQLKLLKRVTVITDDPIE